MVVGIKVFLSCLASGNALLPTEQRVLVHNRHYLVGVAGVLDIAGCVHSMLHQVLEHVLLELH